MLEEESGKVLPTPGIQAQDIVAESVRSRGDDFLIRATQEKFANLSDQDVLEDRIRNLFSNCLMSRYLSCCIGWCLGRCLDDFNHLVLPSAYRGSFEPFRPRDALFDATARKKVEMLFEPIDARYHPEETVT